MTIQNADINVGPLYYKKRGLSFDQLLVTGIFFTLQGEGPFAGLPAIFIRLAGCNRGLKVGMGCEFCDTAFQVEKGVVMSFKEIATVMAEQRQGRRFVADPLMVITGGEPMMQDNLHEFVFLMKRAGWMVQIESNGDRLIAGFEEPDPAVFLVVSPKAKPKMTVSVEEEHGYRELKPEILERADALKFVISADLTSHYSSPPMWALHPDIHRKVWLSPMTVYKKPAPTDKFSSAWDPELVDHDATAANYRHAAGLAIGHGCRVSIQQHLWYQVP